MDRQPTIVGWEITNQCNLSCPHCLSAAGKRAHDLLSTEACKKLLDDQADLGVQMIGWTGGEPLLRNDLEELIAYAKQRHEIVSGLTTNGVLLDDDRVLSLKDSGVGAVQISLDGTTAERSARIRLTTDDEFDKIINGIRLCIKHELRCNLAMILGRETLDDGYAMLDLARREGVTAIRFCGFTPSGRAKATEIRKRFEFDAFSTQLLDFINYATEFEGVTAMFDPGFGPTPPDYEFHECIAGVETLYLTANGTVYPCTSLIYPEFAVGNIHERSLREIWSDAKMLPWSRKAPSLDPDGCGSCENLHACHGACRGISLAYTGSTEADFPMCLYRIKCKVGVR